jgi:hypothetical protein
MVSQRNQWEVGAINGKSAQSVGSQRNQSMSFSSRVVSQVRVDIKPGYTAAALHDHGDLAVPVPKSHHDHESWYRMSDFR